MKRITLYIAQNFILINLLLRNQKDKSLHRKQLYAFVAHWIVCPTFTKVAPLHLILPYALPVHIAVGLLTLIWHFSEFIDESPFLQENQTEK